MGMMDILIDELQLGINDDKKRWIDTKTGWKYLKKPNYNLVGKIKDVLSGDGKKEKRKATSITFVDGRPYRFEEFIERILVIANEKLYNQFNLKGNKESIDLLYEGGNEYELFELKPSDSPNSPAYALVEILKNYLMLIADGDYAGKIKSLNILAPKAYYKKYEASEDFLELLKDVSGEIEVKLLYIDEDFNDGFIKEIIGINPENRETINLSKFKENIIQIKSLKMENWKELTKDNWSNL